MKIVILSLLTLMLSTVVKAQNVATANIRWTSQSTLEANDGQQTEENTGFFSYGAQHLEWKGPDGDIRKNFQIIEAIGEWTNADLPGRIQYEVTDGNFSGTISIRKTESETKIFIAISSEPPQSYVLTVGSYQVL